MNNFTSAQSIKAIEIDGTAVANTFLISGGGVGWVDTDCSGSTVPINATSVQVLCKPSTAGFCAARGLGSIQNKVMLASANGAIIIVPIGITRHLEFYRIATDNTYYIMGYWL
jgi:hypothetical protein